MKLKKINREELIELLEGFIKTNEDCDIVIFRPSGEKHSVVKVEETDKGVFLIPFERNSPFIKIAPMMGSKMHDHKVSEVIAELKKCKSNEIYIQWPVVDLHTIAGGVSYMRTKDGDSVLCLIPVPIDIEQINEEVRIMCARSGCEQAKNGLSCGDCVACGICDILKEVDEEITKIKNNNN